MGLRVGHDSVHYVGRIPSLTVGWSSKVELRYSLGYTDQDVRNPYMIEQKNLIQYEISTLYNTIVQTRNKSEKNEN